MRRAWGRGDPGAHLFVLLDGGGQREPVRHPGDHREQQHLRRLREPNAGPHGRPSASSGFPPPLQQFDLHLSSRTPSDWRLRFLLRWPETSCKAFHYRCPRIGVPLGNTIPATQFRHLSFHLQKLFKAPLTLLDFELPISLEGVAHKQIESSSFLIL